MNDKTKFNIKSVCEILDVWIPLKIQYSNVPGVNICIAHNGNPIYLKSFGYQNLKKKIELNKNSLFRIASHSKMFTSVGIMQLQEKGKLKIDDKVNKYLDWVKGENKVSNNKNITIRQLMSHQSGMFRDGKTHHWSNHKFPNNLKNTISEESIIFENGSTFKYYNHEYALLGAIIEKVSNQKYDDYMYESIINPLNLSSTYPDLPDEVPDDLGFGYERVIPGKLNREIFDHSKTYAYASATGFISNSADIAKFLSSLCLDTEYSVINRESKKEMINEDKVLISKRTKKQHLGGYWEFPGGKIKSNEKPFLALKRELGEELGIDVKDAVSLVQINHDYTDRRVCLDVWVVQKYTGELVSQEGQEIKWLRKNNLYNQKFLE